MTPRFPAFTLIDEAQLLRHSAAVQTNGVILDEKTCLWIIKRNDWLMFKAEQRDMMFAAPELRFRSRNELLGIPVRLTIDDEPDVPRIQLVMEPRMRPKPERR